MKQKSLFICVVRDTKESEHKMKKNEKEVANNEVSMPEKSEVQTKFELVFAELLKIEDYAYPGDTIAQMLIEKQSEAKKSSAASKNSLQNFLKGGNLVPLNGFVASLLPELSEEESASAQIALIRAIAEIGKACKYTFDAYKASENGYIPEVPIQVKDNCLQMFDVIISNVNASKKALMKIFPKEAFSLPAPYDVRENVTLKGLYFDKNDVPKAKK